MLQIGDFRGGDAAVGGRSGETLFDETLSIEVRELRADPARLDVLLSVPELLRRSRTLGRTPPREHGRPTLAMSTFVREVSDSLHLRRFCLIALSECVLCKSTVTSSCADSAPEVVSS